MDTRPDTATAPDLPTPPYRPDPAAVTRAVARRSFCTLATTSPAGRPHVAGVLYELVGTQLWVGTLRSSRKARNLAANPAAAVTIPVRRLPVGPPSSVQFQATVELLPVDHPDLLALVDSGRLRAITSHGELDLPGVCFLRLTPTGTIHTYGLGMPLRHLLRNPLDGAATTELVATA